MKDILTVLREHPEDEPILAHGQLHTLTGMDAETFRRSLIRLIKSGEIVRLIGPHGYYYILPMSDKNFLG